MIDTVGMNFLVRIDLADLSSWGMARKRRGKGFIVYYELSETLDHGAKIQYLYFPYVENGLLKLEFSLPHVVLGNNVFLVFNIEQAVTQANIMLPVVPGIPTLDLWEGVLYRLDICYNHQVGELVPHYVKALQGLKYPYRETIPYTSQDVHYKNGQATTKFYDKEQERLDKGDSWGASHARGILRQETTLRKAAVRKLTGKKKPTLRDITIEKLLNALENDLQKLKLLGRSIGTVDTTLEKLTKQYGEVEGIFHYGWLMAKMKQPSEEALAAAAKAHPKTIKRRLAKIVEAGLPLTIALTEEPLPPLVIDRDMVTRMAMQMHLSKING